MLTRIELFAIAERSVNYSVSAQSDIKNLLKHIRAGKPKKRTVKKIKYSDIFQRAWELYPKSRQRGKANAYLCWKMRIEEGHTEGRLYQVVEMYIYQQVIENDTEEQYIQLMATVFGANRKTYLDFIEDTVPNVLFEIDYCKSAKRLIRFMCHKERIKHKVAYPLPLSLNFRKGFGKQV